MSHHPLYLLQMLAATFFQEGFFLFLDFSPCFREIQGKNKALQLFRVAKGQKMREKTKKMSTKGGQARPWRDCEAPLRARHCPLRVKLNNPPKGATGGCKAPQGPKRGRAKAQGAERGKRVKLGPSWPLKGVNQWPVATQGSQGLNLVLQGPRGPSRGQDQDDLGPRIPDRWLKRGVRP